jgi:hypothetical protein
MDLNLERLLAEVVAKHGIRLDPDDPAVVVVTLNRLVLEETARSMAADVRRAIGEFEVAASRVQGKLGEAVAKSLKGGSLPGGAASRRELARWVSLGFGAGVGTFLAGVAVGNWVVR